MSVYETINAIFPPWIMVVLAALVAVGYFWRSRQPATVVHAWVLAVRGIVFLFLVCPFYAVIWSGYGPDIQLVAMSRIMYFSIMASMLLSHAQAYIALHYDNK